MQVPSQKVVWLASVFVFWVAASDSTRAGDEPPMDRMVGTRVPNFDLKDATTGKRVSLYGFAGKKAVVIVFTGIACPIGDLYLPRLVELQDRYKSQGVVFLAINSNASEGAEQVAEHARHFGLNFPVLLDKTGKVAALLEANRTCEAIILDSRALLRYRGAIDNQYGYGVRKERPTRHYLTDALDAVLAGKPVETTATSVDGCPIERSEGSPRPIPRISSASEEVVAALNEIDPEVDPGTLGEVTYSRHVSAIMQARCQSCHRPGQVGPFSLLTYEDVKRHADGIHEVVDNRRMPPWHADPRYGKFANDRRLTSQERATLIAWVEQGCPQGDPAQEPAPRTWPEGWSVGTPDVVFEIPEPYTVKAEGALPYKRFRVPTGFTEDKWLQAIEPRPGDRSVVHHIIVYLMQPGTRVRSMDDLEHLAAYAPGDLPTVLPPGVAKRVPAGSELLFEIHYTPVGKAKVDRSSVGFVFAKEPPRLRALTHGIPNMRFRIPAGAENHEVKSSWRAPADTTLMGFLPHMHLRGKDFTYTAVYPDGTREILLSVPRYDFAWQSYYWLAEPKHLPKGTRIECVAHFNNSKSNPALTEDDTEQDVTWGEQTWDEMMIGYVDLLETVSEPARNSGTTGS